jgi:hypothetical protein
MERIRADAAGGFPPPTYNLTSTLEHWHIVMMALEAYELVYVCFNFQLTHDISIDLRL